jgi:hypothetical protein
LEILKDGALGILKDIVLGIPKDLENSESDIRWCLVRCSTKHAFGEMNHQPTQTTIVLDGKLSFIREKTNGEWVSEWVVSCCCSCANFTDIDSLHCSFTRSPRTKKTLGPDRIIDDSRTASPCKSAARYHSLVPRADTLDAGVVRCSLFVLVSMANACCVFPTPDAPSRISHGNVSSIDETFSGSWTASTSRPRYFLPSRLVQVQPTKRQGGVL